MSALDVNPPSVTEALLLRVAEAAWADYDKAKESK